MDEDLTLTRMRDILAGILDALVHGDIDAEKADYQAGLFEVLIGTDSDKIDITDLPAFEESHRIIDEIRKILRQQSNNADNE